MDSPVVLVFDRPAGRRTQLDELEKRGLQSMQEIYYGIYKMIEVVFG